MNIQRLNSIKGYSDYNNTNKTKSLSAANINPSFKGAKETKFGRFIGDMYAKYYAKPLYNRKELHDLSEAMMKIPGPLSNHMMALGSAITSGVYMKRTWDNKALDNDKKKTLAVNQGLCFAIPTVLSYYTDSKLNGWVKKQEYAYSGIFEKRKATGELTGEALKEVQAKMGDRLKNVKTLGGIATFTFIFRYASPVLITPLANWAGKFLFGEDEDKKAEEVPINAGKTSVAEEISINASKEIRQSA